MWKRVVYKRLPIKKSLNEQGTSNAFSLTTLTKKPLYVDTNNVALFLFTFLSPLFLSIFSFSFLFNFLPFLFLMVLSQACSGCRNLSQTSFPHPPTKWAIRQQYEPNLDLLQSHIRILTFWWCLRVMKIFDVMQSWIGGAYPSSRCGFIVNDVSADSRDQWLLCSSPGLDPINVPRKFFCFLTSQKIFLFSPQKNLDFRFFENIIL